MRIGELAAAVGVPAQTIRFYEPRGLLPEPARGANGYRYYPDQSTSRVAFIRAAQAAGLTLTEIGIIDLRDDGHLPCAHVTNLIDAKLADVRGRMRDLAALATGLEQLLDRSHHLDPADCTDTDICHIIAAPTRPRRG